MDEPARAARRVEHDGAVALGWLWPQAVAGPRLVWLQPADPSTPLSAAATVEVARAWTGDVVGVEDPVASAALSEAGMPMVRHVHGLAADPAEVVRWPVRDDVRFAPMDAAPLPAIAGIRMAAFPDGHPDHVEETLERRLETYALELVDPDNPLHPSSRTAWLGDDLVGVCQVTDSRHFPGFVGPWVMSVSRRPGAEARGVGAALLVESARAVLDAGGDYLGLAVTDSNPARRLYERMGWSGLEMWLHHVPGGEG